jgi:universal stress protein E
LAFLGLTTYLTDSNLMKRFNNIVFVSDFNGDDLEALKQAIKLAQSNQAQLTVVGCFEDLSRLRQDKPVTKHLIQDMLDQKTVYMTDLLSAKNIKFNVKTFLGNPFMEIIKEVMDHDRDLLIKPVESKPQGLSRILFSSLDLKLLRKCPCPVWLIKSTEQTNYKEIVVALDYEPENPECEMLNTELMTMGISLAMSDFAQLHVVHSWDFIGEDVLRSSRMQHTDEEVDAMVAEEEAKRRTWLSNKTAACLNNVDDKVNQYLDPKLHVIKGEARYAIPHFINELGAELVIMGTVGRTGIAGYIIGNTAESILNAIDCSVLAVKPKDFLCPVNVD